MNEEYAAKRQSRRLGPIRLQVLKTGSWAEWDRNRLARTGGTMEQYKRPALVSDTKLRDSLAVEEEWTGGPVWRQGAARACRLLPARHVIKLLG